MRPQATAFKPAGVPGRSLATIALGLDEIEALRLADLEGLYQEEAASRMGISRATFGRLVEGARRKVAHALLESKMLIFEGGPVIMAAPRSFQCDECGKGFEVPFGTGRPAACPHCHGQAFHRGAVAGGAGRGRCARHGHGTGGAGGARCRMRGSATAAAREEVR
jgi:uncharacterized protein